MTLIFLCFLDFFHGHVPLFFGTRALKVGELCLFGVACEARNCVVFYSLAKRAKLKWVKYRFFFEEWNFFFVINVL